VILTYGPYAKGLAFQEGYPDQWQRMAAQHPDVTEAQPINTRTGRCRPEKWVPDGYACVRVDSVDRPLTWIYRPFLTQGDWGFFYLY